jgi:hypothetical protein
MRVQIGKNKPTTNRSDETVQNDQPGKERTVRGF